MTEIEQHEEPYLGVTVSGSAQDGHRIILKHNKALSKIFGTEDQEQAGALVMHCMKVLKPDESDASDESNDDRMFMLSIVNDLAPRDAVERMLAVQMAASRAPDLERGELRQCQGKAFFKVIGRAVQERARGKDNKTQHTPPQDTTKCP